MVIFNFTGRKGYSSIFSSTHKEEKGREGKNRKWKKRERNEGKEEAGREVGRETQGETGEENGRRGRNCRDTP